jgi:hypothetical protein
VSLVETSSNVEMNLVVSCSWLVAVLVILHVRPTPAWNLPLPGGRNVSFDAGIIRIQLQDTSGLPRMPPPEVVISPTALNSIAVKDTGTQKGFGAFCTSALDQDQFLGFYEGDTITSLDGVGNTEYVMSLDGGATFLNGFKRAQDRSTFAPVHLNHEDKGKAGCNCLRILDDGRVAFFTARRIGAGEELCFDYGASYWEGRKGKKI